MKRKLQRTATFVSEKTIIVDDVIKENGIVYLEGDDYYRYNENQLDVYVNGTKLNKILIYGREPEIIEQYGYYLKSTIEGESDTIVSPLIDPRLDDYEDEFDEYTDEQYENYSFDQGYFERKRAAVCTMFKINKHINVGDIITYKITTNVYSYDHINTLLDNLESRLGTNSSTILNAYDDILEHKKEINARIEEVENKVFELENSSNNNRDESYIDSLGVLSMSNMPAELLNTMITSLQHINTNFTYDNLKQEYLLTDVRSHDYLTVVRRDVNGHDHFLIPNMDYIIVDSVNNLSWTGSVFTILNNENWETGDIIYITGLKLSYGRAGR